MAKKKDEGSGPDEKYKNKAEQYMKDPEKTEELLKKAKAKLDGKEPGPLQEVKESLLGLFRLIKAYIRGDYRETPWTSMLMFVTAIVYFVSPFDAIVDAIPLLGYVDDASLIAWTVKTFADDIDNFLSWEAARKIEAA